MANGKYVFLPASPPKEIPPVTGTRLFIGAEFGTIELYVLSSIGAVFTNALASAAALLPLTPPINFPKMVFGLV
jgi:hypothetical protein